jgi:GMP synthase-like glutamine amidotransferase
MEMRTLAIIFQRAAGAGVFADVIGRRGHELDYWIPSEGALPRELTDYGAVFAFGGGMQADQDDIHPWLRTVLDAFGTCVSLGIPTLGLCLGGQVLARAAGGSVGPAAHPECGWEEIELTDEGTADALFDGKPRRFAVYQWHSYEFGLPPGAVPLARSPVSLQCFRIGACAWGVQWHPEVTGETILGWARDYPHAVDGVPIALDLDALQGAVTERIADTNDDGRDLCARFLAHAEMRAAAA